MLIDAGIIHVARNYLQPSVMTEAMWFVKNLSPSHIVGYLFFCNAVILKFITVSLK